MTYTICESCIDIKDKACVDECPVDCIYEGPRMLYIHPDECVDCGACEPVCPVTAIFYEDDVPAEWKQFTPINAEWFNDTISGIGSPGGAAQVGPSAGSRTQSGRSSRRGGCVSRASGERSLTPRSPGCGRPSGTRTGRSRAAPGRAA